MQCSSIASRSSAQPRLEDHFISATFGRFISRRHPYDFIDTYLVLRQIFGYNAHYVNLGYWDSGIETHEPGRQLAIALAEMLELGPGQCIVEVGSGLGQAAVDLCRTYDLSSYVGLNINARQVLFANALAHAEGLGNHVSHVVGDACKDLPNLEPEAYRAILAIECVGHFRNPEVFLSSAYNLLPKGGRIAFCLNVAKARLGAFQRGLYYSALGFLPTSLDTWTNRLRNAGFTNIKTVDWTDLVLSPSMDFALNKVREGRSKLNSLLARYIALQFKTALRSTSRGELGYYAVTATVSDGIYLHSSNRASASALRTSSCRSRKRD